MMTDNNPLLTMAGLPPFSHIQIAHIVPAIETVLSENRQQINQLLDNISDYHWDNTLQIINDLDERLNSIWSPIEHLHNVADSEELRQAYNTCLPLLTSYYSEMGQNQRLYQLYQTIAQQDAFKQLDRVQQKIIQNALRDFHLSGIDLPADQQTRYKEIRDLLSKKSNQFSENVLDATHGWKKHVTDNTLLNGLPPSAIALAKQKAEQNQLVGWLFSLDLPSYLPVLNYADNRELRREMYTAYMTRASDQGDDAGKWDNTQIINDILALRHELAHLLNFNSYADYSLATKMAETSTQVIEFLTDLAKKARPFAEKDLLELCQFAEKHYNINKLELWDIPYYSEKLREHRYAISQEQLRPYFPLSKVLPGLFHIANQLYGLTIQENQQAELWHSTVQFFDIFDESGELRGQFYLDPYARVGKRSGAWMAECLNRNRTPQKLQIPVAYLACNFTPPVGETPSLLTHEEMRTLFHEFGHGLHHLLTKIDYAPVAGIKGVAWDAVELPSQFMENWCWEKEALDLFAIHYQTGEKIPDNLFERLLAAKHFQSGLFMLRQLEFALFDFRLHHEYQPNLDVQALLDNVRQQIAVLIPPKFNRYQHSFAHIFSGGYAAGYYSYKWAEVLSADAFDKFKENGIFDRATGQQFMQHILEKGGSQEPMALFTAFRGREPKIDALLKQSGMLS